MYNNYKNVYFEMGGGGGGKKPFYQKKFSVKTKQ